jgi:hypothetical protein
MSAIVLWNRYAVAVALSCAVMITMCHDRQAKADFINGGFETGDFTGWTVGGTTASSGVAVQGTAIKGASEKRWPDPQVVAHTGRYAAYGVLTNGFVYHTLTLSQTTAINPDTHYAITFSVNIGSTAKDSTEAQAVVWVNGSRLPNPNDPYIPNPPVGTSSTDFETVTFYWQSGADDDDATVEFFFVGSDASYAPFNFDDFSITHAPEPATLSLLGAALLGIGAFRFLRRRRVG